MNVCCSVNPEHIQRLWHQLWHCPACPNLPACVWTPLIPAASRYPPDGQRAASAKSAGNGCPWNRIFKLMKGPNTQVNKQRWKRELWLPKDSFRRHRVFYARLSSMSFHSTLTHLSSCLLWRQSEEIVQGKNWPLYTWLVRITQGSRNFGHKL